MSKGDDCKIYGLLFVLTAFLLVVSLGPGVFTLSNQSTSIPQLSWQFNFFNLLCHQDSERSFFIQSTQMAACSRCFGIYSFLFLTLLSLPLIRKIQLKDTFLRKFMYSAILLNIFDVIGNYFQWWTNTLVSRYIFGAILGAALILFLKNSLLKSNVEVPDYGS